MRQRSGPGSTGTAARPPKPSLTVDELAADPWDDFAAGYRMGYEAGHDVGYGAAEFDMAEAWSVEVHRTRALGKPDDYLARVRATELHVRRLAERQWLNRAAWESAARASGGTMSADDLARALGVRLAVAS